MKVIGYVPSWDEERFDRINFDVLTHVIYSFAIPTEKSDFLPLYNEDFAKKVVSTAHSKGVKAFLSLGGWSDNDILLEPVFVKATATPKKIETFTDNILALISKYGFDGVDMDWEHPRIDDGSYLQYEDMMEMLSEKLHSINKELSVAVVGGVDDQGNIGGIDAGGVNISNAVEAHTDKVIACCDIINIMAYNGPGEFHAPFKYAQNCIAYWKYFRDLPPEKLLLGLPLYAYGNGTVNYDTLIEEQPDAYLSDTALYKGKTINYNGIQTILDKIALVKEEEMDGIFFWAITRDSDNEKANIQNAIKDYVK